MNAKLWKIILVLTASVAVFMLGCSDSSTNNNTGPGGPASPTLYSPTNGQANVGINPTTFRWSTAERAVGYSLQTSTNAQFTSPESHDAGTDTTFNVANLTYGQAYYWRVQARDSADLTSFSEHFSFTTVGALTSAWDAQANWRDSVGVDQMRYTFAADSGYTWFYSVGATSVTHSGTVSRASGVMSFHETNDDGTPVDTTYHRNYTFTSPYATVMVEWREGTTTYDIVYDRVP